METEFKVVFHPGRAPTKAELKLKKEKEKYYKRKELLKKKNKKSTGPSSTSFSFNGPIFNILPSSVFHPKIHGALNFTKANPTSLFHFQEMWRTPPFQSNSGKGLEAFWSKELVKEIEEAIFITQQKRFSLRKFLHTWRYKRLEKGCAEDFLTGLPPAKPVYIVDWKLKKSWIFEATSLMRDLTSRLYNHDGFFEEPLSPRNPYTNQLLTPSQTISLWNQLSTTGIQVSTPFTSFRAARWNIKRFAAEQSVPLQLFAFRQTMKNLQHIDTQERMLDFIQTAYDNESVDFYKQAYVHAICKYPNNCLIKKWQQLCLKFYETEIAFYNNLDKKDQIQNKIWDETIKLLDKQRILLTLRNEDLRNSVTGRGDTPFPSPIPRFTGHDLIEIPYSLLTHIVAELEYTFSL